MESQVIEHNLLNGEPGVWAKFGKLTPAACGEIRKRMAGVL